MAPIDKGHDTCWVCRATEKRAAFKVRQAEAEALPMPTDRAELIAEIRKFQDDSFSIRVNGRSMTLDEYAADEKLCPLGDLQSLLTDVRTMDLLGPMEAP